MEIKILGTGCPNCERLEKNARKALAGLAMNATVTKVTDMQDILAYDIISTPGLVIDEQVVASGRVPNPNEITSMITTALTAEDA
jgi:small redox-active disulfide protein 2